MIGRKRCRDAEDENTTCASPEQIAALMHVLRDLPSPARVKSLASTVRSVTPATACIILAAIATAHPTFLSSFLYNGATRLVDLYLHFDRYRPFALHVHTKLLTLLQAEGSLTPRLATRMRGVIDRIATLKGIAFWSLAWDGIELRKLRDVYPDLATQGKTLLASMPSALAFRQMFSDLWLRITTCQDAMFFDQCARLAWRLEDVSDSADALTCPICFTDVASSAACGILSCGHKLCASCIARLVSDSQNNIGGTFRCPMRCSTSVIALPCAIVQCLTRERNVVSALSPLRDDPTPVTVTPNQWVQLRLCATQTTWTRVIAVKSRTLFTVGHADSPMNVLARSDIVLGVRDDAPSEDETYLSPDALWTIANENVGSITFFPRDPHATSTDEEEDAVMHFMACNDTDRRYERVINLGTVDLALMRVLMRFPGSQRRTLPNLYAILSSTHFMLSQNLLSTCACGPSSVCMQTCILCKQQVCAVCYGSVFAICALCRETEV